MTIHKQGVLIFVYFAYFSTLPLIGPNLWEFMMFPRIVHSLGIIRVYLICFIEQGILLFIRHKLLLFFPPSCFLWWVSDSSSSLYNIFSYSLDLYVNYFSSNDQLLIQGEAAILNIKSKLLFQIENFKSIVLYFCGGVQYVCLLMVSVTCWWHLESM